MAGPITSWQIEGEKVKAVTDFLFLGSKITVDGDCSLEIRRWLLLDRKTMKNLDNALKSKDITLPTEVLIVKAMVFPVVTYSCENWTIKKADCWRLDAFELWCCSRLLKVPWTARRSNQSFLKEINAEYSLEGLDAEASIIWPFDANSQLIGKETLMLGKLKAVGEGDRAWGGWMAFLMPWTWTLTNSRRWWGTQKPGVLHSTGVWRVRHDLATEQRTTAIHFCRGPSQPRSNPGICIVVIFFCDWPTREAHTFI